MWRNLSLRARVGALLGALFLAALTAGSVLLWVFATEQMMEENEPAERSARSVAAALNAALEVASNPDVILEAFTNQLNGMRANGITFSRDQQPLRADRSQPVAKVPDWFIQSLDLPNLAQQFPVFVHGRQAGALRFEPDLSAQIYEKWMVFLGLVASSIALAGLGGALSYATIGAALRPLRDLSDGLTRLRNGDFAGQVSCSGPPEIHESCVSVNDLAVTLGKLHSENRSLLRRMVSVQDEERRDISRELHDELGPLLFAIRANVTAMVDDPGTDAALTELGQQRVLQAVEALQIANRRILDRLRPLLIDELGLDASIQKLLRDVHAQVPSMIVSLEIDPAIVNADNVVAQTVYRVLQESITNVLKHARATRLDVKTKLMDGAIHIEVADNGANGPAVPTFGRGLTGMRERLRALDGTFDYLRVDGRTVIRCSLPMTAPDQAA